MGANFTHVGFQNVPLCGMINKILSEILITSTFFKSEELQQTSILNLMNTEVGNHVGVSKVRTEF